MADTMPLHLRKFSVVRYLVSDRHPVLLRHCQYSEVATDMFDMHYELELGIVMAGRILRQYLMGEVSFGCGEAWLHPALEPHGCIITEVPCDLLVFIIQPEFLELSARRGHNWMDPFLLSPLERPRGDERARSELLRLARRLTGMAEAKNVELEKWSEVMLLEAILLLEESRGEASCSETPGSGTSSYVTSEIQPALSLVYESREHVDVEQAANACNMNRRTFNDRFAGLMGMSFAKFALNHRLNGAATQLRATSDPVKSVASDWGFRDISHLTKLFTARYRVTPGEYRKKNPASDASDFPPADDTGPFR